MSFLFLVVHCDQFELRIRWPFLVLLGVLELLAFSVLVTFLLLQFGLLLVFVHLELVTVAVQTVPAHLRCPVDLNVKLFLLLFRLLLFLFDVLQQILVLRYLGLFCRAITLLARAQRIFFILRVRRQILIQIVDLFVLLDILERLHQFPGHIVVGLLPGESDCGENRISFRVSFNQSN